LYARSPWIINSISIIIIIIINNNNNNDMLAVHENEKANSAFHPSGVGKRVPATAGKAKAGMVHSDSG